MWVAGCLPVESLRPYDAGFLFAEDDAAGSSLSTDRRTTVDARARRPDRARMSPTLADVAAVLRTRLDPPRRAGLERLALLLLAEDLRRHRLARLRALVCRRTLDVAQEGGGGERRDVAAA